MAAVGMAEEAMVEVAAATAGGGDATLGGGGGGQTPSTHEYGHAARRLGYAAHGHPAQSMHDQPKLSRNVGSSGQSTPGG